MVLVSRLLLRAALDSLQLYLITLSTDFALCRVLVQSAELVLPVVAHCSSAALWAVHSFKVLGKRVSGFTIVGLLRLGTQRNLYSPNSEVLGFSIYAKKRIV